MIDIITNILTSRGYVLTISKLYASDFEVPQKRRRVLIFGIKNKYTAIPEPTKVSDDIPVSSILEENVDESYYLSERAIKGIFNKKERSLKEGKGFGAQFLNLDKPSFTIPSRYWKDGYDALVKYSDERIRRLTIRELSRIQSFPDSYEFCGSKKDIIIQIGNAVACKFSYHMANHLIKYLDTDYEIYLPSIGDYIFEEEEVDDSFYQKKTISQLKDICREKKISRYLDKKQEIIDLIMKNA